MIKHNQICLTVKSFGALHKPGKHQLKVQQLNLFRTSCFSGGLCGFACFIHYSAQAAFFKKFVQVILDTLLNLHISRKSSSSLLCKHQKNDDLLLHLFCRYTFSLTSKNLPKEIIVMICFVLCGGLVCLWDLSFTLLSLIASTVNIFIMPGEITTKTQTSYFEHQPVKKTLHTIKLTSCFLPLSFPGV